ncbi:sialic acid-binding Ig-like lectin 14 [Platysternon megacephalum]|uniref:Sialic acid-binding Ig-like lectin 14 n=1 Tax=Platysternon megacephalum TaxID=55544 RepID=A0A4D9DN21_9SAUR|nr:sialic acid-binding Ig-like lectin 14 [Platysternon megacephalum]
MAMSQRTDPVAPALQPREPNPGQKCSAALHRLPAIVAPRVAGTSRAKKSGDRGAAASSSRIPKPMERDLTTRGSRRHAPQLPVDRPAIRLPPDKPPDTHHLPPPEKPLPDDQQLQGADRTAEHQLPQKDHPPRWENLQPRDR